MFGSGGIIERSRAEVQQKWRGVGGCCCTVRQLYAYDAREVRAQAVSHVIYTFTNA